MQQEVMFLSQTNISEKLQRQQRYPSMCQDLDKKQVYSSLQSANPHK